MNKLTATTTALALLGSTSYALAQNDLATMLDLTVKGMMDNGATVTYANREVGNDGSVLYKNLVISAPDQSQSVTISTDWLKGVPSADDPTNVTFTTADKISVSGSNVGEDYSFDIFTTGLVFSTNALLQEAMSTADLTTHFGADSFRMKGGNPDSAILRNLLADFGAINFDVLYSPTNMHTEGALNIEKSDAIYDVTFDGQTQNAKQTGGATSVEFAFDIPADDADMLGYLDGSKTAFLTAKGESSAFDSMIDDANSGTSFRVAGIAGPASIDVAMKGGTFTLTEQLGELRMTVTPGAGIPIPPVDFSLGGLGMNLIAPANSAQAPEKATLGLNITDLSVGEGLWSMIDPEKTIPRDPAQLNINLDAMVQVDPEAAMAGADPLTFTKFLSLDVNDVLLSLAGAKAQATGALAFNNDGPVPMPLGKVNVEVNGVSGLADKLVALGLIEQMQAGMAVGIMMAYAKAGDKPDQFLSEITFTDSGILANGQPIQ